MVTKAELLAHRWNQNFGRDATGAPLITPLFVAEHGPAIQVADLRGIGAATGVQGYIPGSSFAPRTALDELVESGAFDSPLVLVCSDGFASGALARDLEQRGLEFVAAMAGGIAAWRDFGMATTRDATGIRTALYEPTEGRSASGPLTLEEVRAHIGDPRSVHWIKLTSMLAHARISCIDGRDERCVVGAPGGDGGEFLLVLAAIEKATGRLLDEASIRACLLARLDVFGHFYLHTDVLAFTALMHAIREDPRLQSAVSELNGAEQWHEFVQNAAPELRDALLEHLIDPAHIGCGHIRLMLQRAAEYGTRTGLVVSFLTAFYRLWWEGASELDLTLLPGEHEEGAVVNVRLEESVWGLSRVPLISPSCNGRQMFVNHPDVSAFLRAATVRLLVREGGPLGIESSTQPAVEEAVDALAAQQLGATVGHLAHDLPIFEVVFAANETFEVRSAPA